MLMTTTTIVDGRPISRYLGIVTGEAIIGANIFRDMFAGVRDIVGGRSGTYEKGLAEARELALGEMRQRAVALGATAVIAVDLAEGDVLLLGRGEQPDRYGHQTERDGAFPDALRHGPMIVAGEPDG